MQADTAARRAAAALPASTPGHPANVVDFRGVTKTYPPGDAGVRDITFSVRQGEFVAVIGPSFSGVKMSSCMPASIAIGG